MSVEIQDVVQGSPAARKGIGPGDILVSINGHGIEDVLDYQFYATDQKLRLVLTKAGGKTRRVTLRKEEYEDTGLLFETYLMDEKKHCKNKCIFCFIDQMPKGMRESLYFKDDDVRLSFLQGNYITLTNLSQQDVDRIIRMHISPINVSVHTTNPQLRVQMMKNPAAGEALRYLRQLAEGGVRLNCQLVLCPGINDGEELVRTLEDLARFLPQIDSIAAVPVGLTKHRGGLYEIQGYDRESALRVIETIADFQCRFIHEVGQRVVYASDEFFLQAGLPLPQDDYYGDYPQLENGVGMCTLLKTEFEAALRDCTWEGRSSVSLATGAAAYPLISALAERAMERYPGARIRVYQIDNECFGNSITVAGLLTGGDILSQLKGKELGETLLLPQVTLRAGTDVFLDDLTVGELSRALGVPVRMVENDGAALLDAMLSR